MSATAGSPTRRVQSRLLRVFLLQLALISAATVLGVLAAGYVAERVLVKRALAGEADYFWERRAFDPSFPLPHTLNLSSFMISAGDVDRPPERPSVLRSQLAELSLGMQSLPIDDEERIVHVSERGDERLYLVFQDETVSRLAFWFGLVPLMLVLLVMYSVAWMAYVLSKRAVSPLTELAGVIERFDVGSRDAAELDLSGLSDAPDAETRVLVDAIGQFAARGRASIERERNFTRYASHELRTPLAVISGSVSTLELARLEGAAARAVERIGRTARHMSELIGTLLLLARDNADGAGESVTDVDALLETLLAAASASHGERSEALRVDSREPLRVRASEATLSIVIGNLVRNALIHADGGRVDVVVERDALTVRDDGPGLDAEARERVFEPFYRGGEGVSTKAGDDGVGLGLGLAIVRQTCDNHGWTITLDSEPGIGSSFRVDFGRSAVPPAVTDATATRGPRAADQPSSSDRR